MTSKKDFGAAAQIVNDLYLAALAKLGDSFDVRKLPCTAKWASSALIAENVFISFFRQCGSRFDEKRFRSACRAGTPAAS
jgi:hypothetical protein